MFVKVRTTRAKLVMKRWRENDQPRKRRCAEVECEESEAEIIPRGIL
jgi:hypothetical protein